MKPSEDRRAPNVRRVTLSTLVDICSQEGAGSPFQAHSANVSGRGMHVRTSYLPEVGEELVCRLSHDEQEILVEGRVAWRAEGQDSGEFGIQFTALDADSADILQSLGEPTVKERALSPIPPEVLDEESGGAELFSEGSRVKLHIDGLGAPMKACVHEGSSRKLRVGSALEFLKMGRDLQVEDVGEGARRGATVDSVNVVINPTTSVPELVVQLRYEGMSPTPPPADVKKAVREEEESFSAAAPEVEDELDGDLSEDDAAPWEPAAEALRARLGGAMKSAGVAASRASSMFGSVAQSARDSVVQAANSRAGSAKKGDRSAASPGPKRRQTTRRASRVAPSHLRSGIHDLGLAGAKKKQAVAGRRVAAAVPEKSKRRLAPVVLFGAAFLLFGGSALAFRTLGDSEPKSAAAETSPPATSATPKAAVATAAPSQAPKKKEAAEDGVVAEVPLFGPQAMAVKPKEEPKDDIDVAEAEKRSAAAAVEDQTWEETAAEAEEPQSKPWGKGRLYLPTIHRIRLDGVGAALAGAVNPDGFTVVVPGRKAMESGKTIQKRDKRIVAVETSNGARGATVKFEFRGSVPPYRVRLRQDFVEFLISAPEDTVARL